VGREDNYNNPHGSNPSPAAKDIPTALWTSEVMPVQWRGIVGGQDTASWKSPTFDLRPDLRSAQSMVKAGVPIWSTSARLYVQIFGLTTLAPNTQFLRLEYREFGNTTWGQVTQAGPNRAVPNSGFPNQTSRDPVVQVGPIVDITSEVMLGTNQPDSVILVFETLGEGYPVRYWSVELLWTNVESVSGPELTFQAAMY
jgi:hypothetical protein